MPQTPTDVARGADPIGGAAALSNEAIAERLDGLFRDKAAVEGAIVVLLGEVARRQAYRDEGATATEPWAVERFGVSAPTARALTRLGEQAWDLPHLVGSLCAGDLSLDKVRAVADVATPESDQDLCERARDCSVRQLGDIARTAAAAAASAAADGSAPAPRGGGGGSLEHSRRFLRFNEQFRTVSVQLPAESYAQTRACLEARARQVPSDGETPWDQRLCDAFVELIGLLASRCYGPGPPRRARTSWSSTSPSAPSSTPRARRRPSPVSSNATA